MQTGYTYACVLCSSYVPQRLALQPDLPHLALLCVSGSHEGKQVQHNYLEHSGYLPMEFDERTHS